MNNGHKSAIVRMHNQGLSIIEIAGKTGLEQPEIKAFLMTRVNYPNIISANHGAGIRYRSERKRDSDRGVVRKVTLPHVRILDSGG